MKHQIEHKIYNIKVEILQLTQLNSNTVELKYLSL